MMVNRFVTAASYRLAIFFTLILLALGMSDICLAGRSFFLLYDTSRSLSEQDLENALELGREMVRSSQEPSDLFGVMRFDDTPRLLAPLGDAQQALSVLQSMGERSGNFTTLNDALYDALKSIRVAGTDLNAILLFTDGNDENSVLLFDDVVREATNSRTAIYPVVVGTRTDERTLRRYAKLSGGAFYAKHWLNDAAGFSAELNRELENRSSLLAATVPPVESLPTAPPAEHPADASDSKPASELEAPAQEAPSEAEQDSLFYTILFIGLAALAVLAVVVVLRSKKAAPAPPSEAKKASQVVPRTSAPFQAKPASPARDPAIDESLESTVILSNFPTVEIRRGSNAGEIFLLKTDGSNFVGRAKTNHICVHDDAVTSRHCEIRGDGESFVVQDLGSTNGTFVNDHRVDGPSALKSGDVLRIGETELVFKYQQHRD